MQKNVLKHQFENFSTASNESLDKAYDRFQKLISQLEVHGAPISKEEINQKFLRSLPSSWNQIALIMRNKSNIDEIDIDDLYNNLRVYEDELKRSLGSNSASQNLAFLSSENTSSITPCVFKSLTTSTNPQWDHKAQVDMSVDSAITYTSVHSEARSWSIPSEDPYEEAAQQLFEQAPRSPEYVPENHIPVYIPEPEHPEDLVPAEDEAPIPPLPPFFLAPHIRPLHTRAAMRQMRATAPSTYHSLLPSGTPPLLPIPLPTPSTSRRADIPEADTPPRKRLLLTTPRPECEIGESSAAAAARQPGPTIETRLLDTERRMMTALELVNRRITYQVDVCTRESSEFCTRHHDAQKDRAAVRAEIEVLRRERLAYEQESMETRQALAKSEAHCRALEARVTVLETEARRHEWQRQAADDLAVQHIMRTQALEAGARIDTLEDTGSSS
ncbi:hypothetical protein Tco_0497282 [Tanacetum coccineum]